jgi:hypothetical protein
MMHCLLFSELHGSTVYGSCLAYFGVCKIRDLVGKCQIYDLIGERQICDLCDLDVSRGTKNQTWIRYCVEDCSRDNIL